MRRDRCAGGPSEQLSGRRPVEPTQQQLGDARGLAADQFARAPRQQQHDALGLQPPCREDERLSRRSVQPRRVVDHGEQRRALRDRGEQAQHRDIHREAVARRRRAERERTHQRRTLWPGERVERLGHGSQEIGQTGEGELGLRLDAARAQYGHAVGRCDDRLKQRALAVAFASAASDLSPDDGDRDWDVFVRDLWAHTTILVSRATGAIGAPGDGASLHPAISADASRSRRARGT